MVKRVGFGGGSGLGVSLGPFPKLVSTWEWIQNFCEGKKKSSPNGLEPPIFRLTAERAKRLRPGDVLRVQRKLQT